MARAKAHSKRIAPTAVLAGTVTAPPWTGALPTIWLRDHTAHADFSANSLRQLPYATRGRDHETAHMVQFLTNPPTGIQLIIGAPGAGKTALLANVTGYMQRLGATVRRIRPMNFESNVALADAIRGRGRSDESSPSEREETTGAKIQLGTRGTHAGSQVTTTEKIQVDRSSEWYRAILEEATVNPERGLIMWMDEAQDMKNLQDDAMSWNRGQQFLQVMNSDLMSSEERPKAALVCAGLLNASLVLNSFGMSRIEVPEIMRLGPLSDRAMRQVLDDHRTAATPTGEPLPELPETLVEELLMVAGGSPRHISGAGLAIQKTCLAAQAAGRDTLKESECEEIMREAEKSRRQLYLQRVDSAGNLSIEVAAEVLAQATDRWGALLPRAMTEDLIATVAKDMDTDANELRNDLIAKGFIERRHPDHTFPTLVEGSNNREHYSFAIVSMADFLNDRRLKEPSSSRQTARNQKWIDDAADDTEAKTKYQEWRWDESKPLPPVLPIQSRDEQRPPSGAKRRRRPTATEVLVDEVTDTATEYLPRTVKRLARKVKRKTAKDDV